MFWIKKHELNNIVFKSFDRFIVIVYGVDLLIIR